MRQVVYGEDKRFIDWAADRIGIQRFRDDAKAIGLERDGQVIASVVFDGFSSCDCNMHVASDGSRLWLNREYLVRCFAFPFIQCGLRRVTGLVPAKNRDALRFDRHLGFQIEGLCREALPDDDILILGLLRRDCKYIPKEHRL